MSVCCAVTLSAKVLAIPLKKPPKSLKADLVKVLVARKMIKSYAKKPVSLNTLSTLLWCAGGVTKPRDGKPLYGLDAGSSATESGDRKTIAFPFDADCLDLYVLMDRAVYRYQSAPQALVTVTNGDYRARAGTMTGGVPVVLLITADLDRFPFTIARKDRLYYAHTSAGAMLQNIALASAALGIGHSVYSEVNQSALINILKLGPQQAVLYLVTAGYPLK
jgi:nitroreductase